MRTSIRGISLASAGALALALAFAFPALAQTPASERLSRAEIQRTGAQTLYDAIVAARPSWLTISGEDLTTGEGLSRVLVYVDRRRVGDLRALRTIPADDVAQARLRGPRQVRALDPQYPRTPFVAGIFVSSYREVQAGTGPRTSASVSFGMPVSSLEQQVGAVLEREGFLGNRPEGGWFADSGTDEPWSVVASVMHRVRGPLALEVVALRALEGWAGGYDEPSAEALSARFTTTEAMALATYAHPLYHVGGGVAVRHSKLEWARGFCGCSEPESQASTAVGLAGSAVGTFPARSRVFAEARALARWYPSQKVGPYRAVPESEAGGFVLGLGLGLGVRF